MSLVLLALLVGCHGKDSDTYVAPDWDNDGLPDDTDTVHQDNRDDTLDTGGDTGSDTGDTGSTGVTFDVTAGLFVDYDGTGLVLLSESVLSCASAFSGAYIDAIYYQLSPKNESNPNWETDYAECGQPPCYSAYWLLGGSFGYLDGDFEIESFDDHYVTAAWQSGVSTGELTFYNCGAAEDWR